MRRTLPAGLLAGLLFLTVGCTAAQQRNTLAGGAIGGGLGAVVGRDVESTVGGAAIGAGAGYLLTDD